MIKFITIEKQAEAEEIIERSRFIAHIKRTDTREEADLFIAEIKRQYKDATHNVPAFVIGEKQDLQWASDDGEPSGTSGAPMLQMLVKEGLTNVTVVVTRYFGGIKLGTGGLVRAYTGVLRLALEKAGRFEVREVKSIKVKLPYSLLTKLQKSAEDLKYSIDDIEYSDELLVTLSFEPEDEERIISWFTDITQGKLVISE